MGNERRKNVATGVDLQVSENTDFDFKGDFRITPFLMLQKRFNPKNTGHFETRYPIHRFLRSLDSILNVIFGLDPSGPFSSLPSSYP